MVLLLSLIRALLDKNLRRLLFRPQSLSTTVPMQFRTEQIFKGTSSEFDDRRGRVAWRRMATADWPERDSISPPLWRRDDREHRGVRARRGANRHRRTPPERPISDLF